MQVGVALRAQHRYIDRVVAACNTDPSVADVYVRILGMVERPSAMFRPHVIAAAARTRRRVPVAASPSGRGEPARTAVGAGTGAGRHGDGGGA
jgi:hypothetical protein